MLSGGITALVTTISATCDGDFFVPLSRDAQNIPVNPAHAPAANSAVLRLLDVTAAIAAQSATTAA